MAEAPARTAKSQRTRAAILKAAQDLFARQGYERTTVRDIAAGASIDPAMVIRYFGSKEGLFAAAAAFDLRLPDLSAVERSKWGTTLMQHFVEMWEGSLSTGSLVILLRASASNEEAADQTRRLFLGQVLPMLAQVIPPAELPVRAGLIASQILGLAFGRYVLKVPPLVMMQPPQLVALIGPTLQRYIEGEI